MEEVLKNTRRENLLLLLQGFPIEKDFAALAGLEPSYLSRIKKTQPIGGKVARQIEHAAGKPYLWLDTPADKHSNVETVDGLKVAEPVARYQSKALLSELIEIVSNLPEAKQRALLEILK